MRKYLIISFIIITIFLAGLIVTDKNSLPTIAYFPIDERVTFKQSKTTITSTNEEDILWSVSSTTSEDAYLRQDISLLYENGKFKGVLSKWQEQTALIEQSKVFSPQKSSVYQAISFHHGEIHYPNDEINSVQQMTVDDLYYVHDREKFFTFHTPTSFDEKKWRKKLIDKTERQLNVHWNSLMDRLDINPQKYVTIPLTNLMDYEQMNFPNHSEEETKQIIGQLWEGIYKNYVVSLAYEKNNETTHYIPLIMMRKDNSHLLIIYERNNKARKLIQKLP